MQWLRSHELEIVVAPIIIGEMRFGILLLPHGKRRTRLEAWFDEGVQRIHCVSWDATVGLRWAELLADLRAAGRSMPIEGGLSKRSVVNISQIFTVDKSDLVKRIGTLSPQRVSDILSGVYLLIQPLDEPPASDAPR